MSLILIKFYNSSVNCMVMVVIDDVMDGKDRQQLRRGVHQFTFYHECISSKLTQFYYFKDKSGKH